MSIRAIVKHPDELLRRKAQPVKEVDAEVKQLLADMVETMRAAPGVGLAGPQVNVPLRVIVVEYGEEPDPEDNGNPPPKQLFTLVNPEITRSSPEKETATEGCLSIPGLVGDVERSTSITVKALNRRGQPVKIKASGWLARIFQHEVDHLNGVLFIDRAEKIHTLEEDAEETPLA
ncbi:MAG TPA: peptide deformylase [Anaerolineales bacterium]|nr:peptide deformylase [Anaerolineales bacterium]